MKKVVLIFIPALICGVLFTSFGSNQAEPNVNILIEYVENPITDNQQVLYQDSKPMALLTDTAFVVLYEEYNHIIESYIVERDGRKSFNLSSVTNEDLNRLKELFLSMSSEQQGMLSYIFQRRTVPAERIPTQEQFESWKSPTDFGIWLDGRRIENSELERYLPSDFSLFYVSRLQRNAVDYGKYVYHLDLNTTRNYRERKERADADETLYLTPNVRVR